MVLLGIAFALCLGGCWPSNSRLIGRLSELLAPAEVSVLERRTGDTCLLLVLDVVFPENAAPRSAGFRSGPSVAWIVENLVQDELDARFTIGGARNCVGDTDVYFRLNEQTPAHVLVEGTGNLILILPDNEPDRAYALFGSN